MSRMFGYSRISSSSQDWSLQLDALLKYGCDERDIYCEQKSGSIRNRVDLYGKSGVRLTHLDSPFFKFNRTEAIQI